MKTLNIITSTMALGVMIGVTGTHYQQVASMSANGGAAITFPVAVPMEQPVEKPTTMTLVSQPADDAGSDEVTANYQKDLDARETALMEILREIRKEQTHIRSQISDTNRDMSELTFRVDSHSTQFRPLRGKVANPRAMVVPDDDYGSPMGSMGAGGLLPPKQ